jgi:hypothetical protein
MFDVRPGQIWKVRLRGNDDWQRVRVVNVILDVVELEYLDRSALSECDRSFSVDRSAMLTTASIFQFVARGPNEHVRRKQRH